VPANKSRDNRWRPGLCVCVCVWFTCRAKKKICVCVCVCERERERGEKVSNGQVSEETETLCPNPRL